MESPEFLDTLYVVLANSARRSSIQYLLTHSGPVSVDRLAIELVAAERDVSPEAVTPTQRAAMELGLRHVHLPMLDDAGVLTWCRTDDLLTLTPLMDHLSITVPGSGGLFELSVSSRSRAE